MLMTVLDEKFHIFGMRSLGNVPQNYRTQVR